MDYLTKQGDLLDDVVARFYGDASPRLVEEVLEANRGLADLGPILPAGVLIALSARAPAQPATITQRLWD